MFRLANSAFPEFPELETHARYCLTETIKSHLRTYFEEGFEVSEAELLYQKVDVEAVRWLFDDDLCDELDEIQYNADRFLQKKIAHFWQLMVSEEEHTPDLFTEYLLYCMTQLADAIDSPKAELPSEEDKKKLKELLKIYVQDYIDLDGDDEEYKKELEIEYFHVLTDMKYLLGYPKPSDNSLAFWDWDFMMFDNAGILNTLKAFANGPLAQEGYDIEGIFSSVVEPAPMMEDVNLDQQKH